MRQHGEIDLFQKQGIGMSRIIERWQQGLSETMHDGIDATLHASKGPIIAAPHLVREGSHARKGDVEADIVERREVVTLPTVAQIGDRERSLRVSAVVNQLPASP